MMDAMKAIALAQAVGGGGGGGDVTVESLSATENGTYTAPKGKAYSPVAVNVPNTYAAGDEGKVVSGGELVSQTSVTVTRNDTYDTTDNNSVTVNVPQTTVEAITITENGTVTAPGGKAYSPITVEVSGGGSTILSGTSAPTAAQGDNGNIYLKYNWNPPLPAGYTAAGYIGVESAGPYIDTGVANASGAYYEVLAQYTATPGNNYGLFGAQTSQEFAINYYGGVYFVIASNGRVVVPSGQTLQMHRFLVDGSGISVDDGALTGAVDWSKATGRNYYIFAINYIGGVLNTANARVYGCKIWNGSTLVRNFVPCVRDSDDAIGMYDLVNSVFYGNSGSGSFIAGENGDAISNAYVKVSGAWQNLIGSNIGDVGGVT